MDSLINLGWIEKSVVAMICLTPLILMFGFFGKNYGVKPEVVMCLWLLGVVIGLVLSAQIAGIFQAKDLYTPIVPIISIVIMGILIGAPANLLVSQSVAAAPNPAIPFAIVNSASAFGYLLAMVLAFAIPRYFDSVQLSLVNFAGILIVIMGLGLTVYRP